MPHDFFVSFLKNPLISKRKTLSMPVRGKSLYVCSKGYDKMRNENLLVFSDKTAEEELKPTFPLSSALLMCC